MSRGAQISSCGESVEKPYYGNILYYCHPITASEYDFSSATFALPYGEDHLLQILVSEKNLRCPLDKPQPLLCPETFFFQKGLRNTTNRALTPLLQIFLTPINFSPSQSHRRTRVSRIPRAYHCFLAPVSIKPEFLKTPRPL